MSTSPPARPVRLLHLSDFHFSARKAWDADPLLRDLARFIRDEVAAGLAPDLVALTGDLAFSGRAEEYRQALDWLRDGLWPALGGLPRDRLLIVPGNHDVDRAAVGHAAQAIQASLLARQDPQMVAELLGDPEERAPLLKRHAAYLDFLREWFGEPQTLPWWSRSLEIRGTRLHVAGLDSALLAQGDQDRGHLLIGRYQLHRTIRVPEAEGVDWRIALLHHPWDYLAEWDLGELREAVHRHCHILLRGHLHASAGEQVVPPDSRRACLELAAGCVYEHSRFANAFQWIELHPAPRRVVARFRAWLAGAWSVDRNVPGAPDGTAAWPLFATGETPPDAGPGRTSPTPPGPAVPHPPPAGSFDFSGGVTLEFCRRLGSDWLALTVVLEIPGHVARTFERGREAYAIWGWLVDRRELAKLPPALARIDRSDLAALFRK